MTTTTTTTTTTTPLMHAVVRTWHAIAEHVQCTIGGWLVSYARSTGNFGVFEANVLASVMWIIFTATRVALAAIALYVHPGWMLLAGAWAGGLRG